MGGHRRAVVPRRDGARSCTTQARPLRRDIDALPWPAYDLFRIERYTNLQPLTDGLRRNARAYTHPHLARLPLPVHLLLQADHRQHLAAPRRRQKVVAEWRYLVRELRATEIGVTDDVWNLDLERAKEICRLLIDEGLTTVPWITIHGMRADHTDLELFQLMKQAGCKRVGFGVESGNQAVLDSIKKQQTIEDVRDGLHAMPRTAGLQTMGFFIFGLPGETRRRWRRPSAWPSSSTPTWPTS